MKAVVYQKRSSYNVLELSEVEKPVPLDNELLVKIIAVSINAADYRSMRMGIIPKRKIFGADIAGEVELTGKNVEKFKIGDEVFGDISGHGFGGFAEYVAVPENALVLKPASVSFEDAAAGGMAAVTALQALRDQGRIHAGQTVLIYGAGGGVGSFAVQLARYYGAEVTAVCSSNNTELTRSIGAEHVIDYSKEDIFKRGSEFDLVLAVNGNHPISGYKRLLTRNGIFVLVGGALSQVIKSLLFGRIMSLGSQKMRVLSAKPSTGDLLYVSHLIEEGSIKPVIDRRYPLGQTAEAMQYVSQGHARGKVIINVV